MDDYPERTVGRRDTDGQEVVKVVEASFLRRFAGWFVAGGAVFCFVTGIAYAELKGDVRSLKENQFTDVEATELVGALNLLRQEITYLRTAMNRIEANQ